MTFSGERLCAIMMLGYRDSKSKALTGVVEIPFFGGDTQAPGYFSYLFKHSMSLSLMSCELLVIGTQNWRSNANLATMFRTFIPSALRKAYLSGVNDNLDTSTAYQRMFRFYHSKQQASESYIQYLKTSVNTYLALYTPVKLLPTSGCLEPFNYYIST